MWAMWASQLYNCSLLTGETGRGDLHLSSHLDRLHCCSLRRISLASHITGPGQSEGIWNQVRLSPLLSSSQINIPFTQDASDCEEKWDGDNHRNSQDVWFHPAVDRGQWESQGLRFIRCVKTMITHYCSSEIGRPFEKKEYVKTDRQTNRQTDRQTDSILALI